jgi:hypothetical protein
VKEAAKEARERAYLQRFRQNFADFPEGEVVPFEHPDFLIKTQSQWIGIEIIEYHVQEPDKSRGSLTRAREGTEDKVLRMASEQHQSKGLPPVAVHVHWNSHEYSAVAGYRGSPPIWPTWCKSISSSRATKLQFVTAVTLRGDHCHRR